MTTTRKVYVSGPMTGYPDLNFQAFKAATQVLRDHGYEVVCPTEVNPDPRTHRHACMRNDVRALAGCDAIALLPGWERSHGARLEVEVALGTGMLIADVDTLVRIAISQWVATQPWTYRAPGRTSRSLRKEAEIAAAEADPHMGDAEKERFIEAWFARHSVREHGSDAPY